MQRAKYYIYVHCTYMIYQGVRLLWFLSLATFSIFPALSSDCCSCSKASQ